MMTARNRRCRLAPRDRNSQFGFQRSIRKNATTKNHDNIYCIDCQAFYLCNDIFSSARNCGSPGLCCRDRKQCGLIESWEKQQKELAFLRDLYIQDEWTQRFTDLVDKHMDLRDSENMLYLNAGTGGHALAIYERFGEKTAIFAMCDDEDMLAIARDKAAAVGSDVDFSTLRFEDDAFDAVLGDASFVRPANIEGFIENTLRVARTGGDIAIFLPTAASYGEVFSFMWEVLFNEDLAEHGAAVEKLVAELPTVSRIEELAELAGLVNINTQTVSELFEYANGTEFIEAPLIADFLMPIWLETLDEDERGRAVKQLAGLIDAEDGDLSFRFTLKATLLTGEKA